MAAMLDGILDEVLGESGDQEANFAPYSPPFAHAETRMDSSFSPNSPLSPHGTSEMHSPAPPPESWIRIGEAIHAGWRAEFGAPGPDGKQAITWIPPGTWQPEPISVTGYENSGLTCSPAAARDDTDDRRTCSMCHNLASGRCLAAQRGEIIAARSYRPDPDRLRRCSGYRPSAADPDQRLGWQRWPGLPDVPTRETREGAA